jgi:ribosome-associated protein
MTPTPLRQGAYFKNLAVAAARAADDKKGDAITLLHIKPVSPLADYMLLINVTSPPHMRAVEEHIRKTLKTGGSFAQHRDGRASDLWRVLDYGGLLIHITHPQAREFYALDRLYHDAKPVSWAAAVKKKAAKKKTAKKKATKKKAVKKKAVKKKTKKKVAKKKKAVRKKRG